MYDTYRELEKIWRSCLMTGNAQLREVIPLLANHGISLRRDDGTLKQINLSIPTTRDNAYIVGFRYIKKDGTCTEDHFLCERGSSLGLVRQEFAHYSKRKLEYVLPEYHGAHKQQLDLSQVRLPDVTTDVRTLSYTGLFKQ